MNTLSEKKNRRFEVQYSPSPSFPKEIFIDIAGACNHSCFFCGNAQTDNNILLDKKLVFRLLQEAYDKVSQLRITYTLRLRKEQRYPVRSAHPHHPSDGGLFLIPRKSLLSYGYESLPL